MIPVYSHLKKKNNTLPWNDIIYNNIAIPESN